MIPVLGHATPFPPVETARRRPNGLLAAGGDLSVSRLVDAYTRGIFPWYSEGDPILWWSPDPRMVLFVDELHVARSLARRLKRGDYEVRADTAFVEVMRACAAPRGGEAGTWISEQMVRAYARLHRAGFAHSIETWMEGQLAGGLYGVAIGRMFFGESMFTRRTDASKIALVHLVRQLAHWGFRLVDCQMRTAHIERFGAREIPRSAFLAAIAPLVARPSVPSPWRLDEDLAADGAARRQP